MRKNIISALVIAGTLALTTNVNAVSLTEGGDNYLGRIVDGIPSNEASEVVYINNLTTLADEAGPTAIGSETYDRIGSTVSGPFPDAGLIGSKRDATGGTTVDATGYTYVLGKYDAAQAGSLVWYFPGGAGEVTLQATLNGKGLSHISLYNPGNNGIPDGGATFLLLGLGLACIGLLKRKQALA